MRKQGNQKLLGKIFLSVSIMGTLFVLTEIILQSFGKSMCAALGCKMVAQHARFGDISILLIGLFIFSALSAFSFLSMYRSKPGFEKYINLVLIVSLACEGFFTGYQAFRMYAPCIFCLAVFGLLVTLGLLRLFSGEKELITGYAAMAAVFSLFYLILPAESNVRIPEQEQLVLFYSKECKFCEAVMKEIEESQIPVNHVLVNEYAGFLKKMGIEHVPTLYVNNNNEKIFLTGKEAIEVYLFPRAREGKITKTPAKAAGRPGKATGSPEKSSAAATAGLLNPQEKSFEISLPSSPEGICKEDNNCR